MCEGFAQMYVVCSIFVCGSGRDQKRESDVLELELGTVVSCQLDAEKGFQGLMRRSTLNH